MQMCKIVFSIFLFILIFHQISPIEFGELGEEKEAVQAEDEAFFNENENSESIQETMFMEENDIDSYEDAYDNDYNDNDDELDYAYEDIAVTDKTAFFGHFDSIKSDNQTFEETEEEQQNESVEEREEEFGRKRGKLGERKEKEEAGKEGEKQGEEEGICEKGWLNYRNELCFYGHRTEKEFYAGVEECAQMKANFASFQSVDEFTFITSHWDLRDFWVGIYFGKKHFEDGTAVDGKVLRHVAPRIPWATPDKRKGFICRKKAKGAKESATKEKEEDEIAGESDRAREEKVRQNTTKNREKESEEITVIYASINKRGGEKERNESDEGTENTEEIGESAEGQNSENEANLENLSGRTISETTVHFRATLETIGEGNGEKTNAKKGQRGGKWDKSEQLNATKTEKIKKHHRGTNSKANGEYSEILVEENTETFAEFLVGANSEANSYESAEGETGQRMNSYESAEGETGQRMNSYESAEGETRQKINSYESAEWEKGQGMNAGDFVAVPSKLLFILPLVALLF
ncbi:hypothetical protein niasHT_032617 [Heterodera trifolii]|uniref:C-type lectin domain-containing protein n=1 Tax=Heterodera trifolii TaxID=157864 RepID=A0ABD2IFK5_9BILA